MEFIRQNTINTTTQLAVDSNTASVANVFHRDPRRQYVSSGYANDLTQTTIRINFTATTTISRIAILECNWKQFDVFYNGLTANTFGLTTGSGTTTSRWNANSDTGLYLTANTITAATSVSFSILSTQSANAEKAVGLIHLSDTWLVFPRDPSAKNYRPVMAPKQIVHELSDGGVRVHHLADRWRAELRMQAISSSFRDSLRTVYDLRAPFGFVPFGTTTAWDKVFFEAVWQGGFEFHQYHDDNPGAGFDGRITLRETPW